MIDHENIEPISMKKKDKKINTTQKNKSKHKDLFKIIDMMNSSDELLSSQNILTDDSLECLYSNDDNTCKKCNTMLNITEEGFYCCTNTKCSIINTDVLDFGAEWRYYGADDTNSSDPTRCGMPINPLLVESSFGCIITCNNNSSYQMRVIKRYTDWQSMP